MKNFVTFLAILVAPLIVHTPPSVAQAADLLIADAYIRTMPPGRTTTAGFLTVTNSGKQMCHITGLESPLTSRIEIHEHLHVDGMMRMRPVKAGLAISVGETLIFRPGGLHIMLFNIEDKLNAGESVRLQLNTDQCGSVEFTAAIRSLVAKPMAGKHH